MATLLAVNNYYYPRGGSERVFLEQNRLYASAGWRVIPFAMRHPSNLETPWADYFVDEIEFGSDYSLWQKLTRLPKVIYSLEARRKLVKILDTVPVDICHLHNIYHHISPSILGLLKRRGIPTVLTAHDLKLACPANGMLTHDGVCERCRGGRFSNLIRHRCIKGSRTLSAVVYLETQVHRLLDSYRANVDRFIVPSRFHLDKLAEWGWPKEKLVHIPNFVDVSAYRARRAVGRPFLYFGRLAAEKGLATLVRAAAAAKVPVHIAGSGPEESRLRALAERLGAEIDFIGHLIGERLKQAIAGCRSVVLPSECYENAPMSVLEAYASGVPVLGAAIGGIGELIREGETGATVTSGSVESLAAGLRRYAELPDDRILAMGRCGRAWVEAEFTGEHYRERLTRLYRELGAAVPA